MAMFSENLQGPDLDVLSLSTEMSLENSPRVQQEQEFEETNKDLNAKFLKDLMEALESDDKEIDWNKIAKLGAAKTTEVRNTLARLTCKFNSFAERFNNKYVECKEISDYLDTLDENYEPFKTLLKKLKSTIEKEKSTRRECDKLKEKQEKYKAREKELIYKNCKLEQRIKEKDDKIEAILKRRRPNVSTSVKCALVRPNNFEVDSSSSLTDYEGTEWRTERQYKYCGMRSKYYTDERYAYQHVRRTRGPLRITDYNTRNPRRNRTT